MILHLRLFFLIHILLGCAQAVYLRTNKRRQTRSTVEAALQANYIEQQRPRGTLELLSPTDLPVFSAPPPNMFVAVMTRRASSVLKRNAIRDLWQQVDNSTGNICTRFVACSADDQYQPALIAEQATYGDLLFLNCSEGYAKGLLTQKLIATLEAYGDSVQTNDACLNRQLFMKVDDDTFVAAQNFRVGMSSAVSRFGTQSIFAGVYSEAAPTVRNSTSRWFEPFQTWPLASYPATMFGGPGYILGQGLVLQMLKNRIPEMHVLWNEDRAVGVWIDILQQQGAKVNWIKIPGTNGFSHSYPIKNGSWGTYPYALHHHLSAAAISCLVKLDRDNNAAAEIGPCFQLDPLPDELTEAPLAAKIKTP